jgi:transposase
MIAKETEAAILRLYFAEKWRIGTIARQVGVHHTTVRRVLARAGVPLPERSVRASILDPYRSVLVETLRRYPTLPASRLYEMMRERGYPGGPDHFRHQVALLRPSVPAEAYLRLRTLPGEQGQVDWAHFGHVTIGAARRPLLAFVLVLSWSRRVFVRFYLQQHLANFLRGHVAAFAAWGGCPRVLLYDNLKSAVLERRGDAIHFHPTLLSFAGHYRYEPRPVPPARGNEKGRVERAIRYVRSSFFAARKWRDLDDLNEQARVWCEGIASDRPCPEDRTMTVRQAFAQERESLLGLPDDPFPTDERVEVKVGKTPYVRFDLNDYSVPMDHTRKVLVVVASPETVRVLAGNEVIATHTRSYGKDEQIEDPVHVEELVAHKRQARQHRGVDRLQCAVPVSHDLLVQVAQRGENLGSAVSALLRLLKRYGAADLETAITEALEQGAPHPHSVRLVLERRWHERGTPAPVPVHLPDDPRVRDLVVRPHDLKNYDDLKEEDDDRTDHG